MSDNNNNTDKEQYMFENENENEEYCETGRYLKNTFSLHDFLEYGKTREILERNRRWQYEKKLEKDIEFFYKGEIDYNKTDLSSMFANEDNYKNLGFFQYLVYSQLKPKYDLEIFYLNPEYAREMVESIEERAIEKEKQRLNNIRNNYLKLDNSKKSFNWKTKTYK